MIARQVASRWLSASSLLAMGLAGALAGCSSGGGGGGSGGVSPPAAYTMRVHYHRNDSAYAGWGVYSWLGPATPQSSGWPNPSSVFSAADPDGWGKYVDIAMDHAATQMKFLILNPVGGGTKDCSADQSATIPDLSTKGAELWVLSGDCTVYTAEPPITYVALGAARAVWLDATTLVWPGVNSAASSFKLYLAAAGGLTVGASGITGADASYPLTPVTGGLSTALLARFPQYAGASTFTVPTLTPGVKAALTGQVAVAALDASGKAIDGTSLQIAPVLDDQYAAAASTRALGVTFDATTDVPTFALWAPTAQDVKLNVYPDDLSTSATQVQMVRDAATGVWSYTAADAAWTNTAYYDYAVKVWTRAASPAGVVTNTVTDPYAVTLNANSQHAMVLNLAGATARPVGWPGTLLPTSATPTDAVIYELHVRDFSARDGSLATPAQAGKFQAFADPGASGSVHLKALADAGLTHVHLLPAFDFATVDEVGCIANPVIPTSTGADLGAELAVIATQATDCFNWGYDPLHFGAPEGSYASDAHDGTRRVLEFRQAIQALHAAGLRVVMDVVYNHTNAAGQAARSVLDRIVPGYYHRLDQYGNVEGDSCCSDTAAEFVMMGKLMTDTLVTWTDQYKVDGFRFDIMGFHPRATLLAARDAVEARTAADGRGHTYFYGEGWNFGHVSNNALFVQASQLNLAGTGVGTFNDRMRDAVRGGGPFDSGAAVVTNQGFISGLCWDNNDASACSATQRSAALLAQDQISVGLAGNLASFPLTGSTTGQDVPYGSSQTGYTGSPQENIAYISAHDNETIWDISQYKHASGVLPADRARAQVVGLSLVTLSQGVPFIHAGDDLLRSKSEDGNSYDSGDYFNRVFWDGSANNWAAGAPPQNTGNNLANLAQLTTVFGHPNAAVTATEIQAASAAFRDFLKLRKDTSMFRLATADQVNACVRFPDQGAGQVPGVIVMQVGDGFTSCGDDKYASVLVVFNATKISQAVTAPWYAGRAMSLHPVQAGGADPVVQAASFDGAAFHVPARTTAVFVESRTNAFTGGYPAMYLRGDMNGWGLTTPMALVAPHRWQAGVTFAVDADPTKNVYGFKFDTGTWASSWPGSNATLKVTQPGTYLVTFDDSSSTYAVIPPVWFPGVPGGVAAQSASATAINLTWTATGGATDYVVFRSPDGTAGSYLLLAATGGATSYADTGLTTGTRYYYQVVAANALFSSAPSVAVSAVPAAGGGPTSVYPAMYMNGSWNTWATGTGAGKMTLTASETWSVTLAIPATALQLQFKFDTDDNWGTTSGGHAWTSTATTLTGTCIVSAAGSGNITVSLPTAGNYTFTFNDSTLAYSIVAGP